MKIIDFHKKITKNYKNNIISNENRENHENIRIPIDNHENPKY